MVKYTKKQINDLKTIMSVEEEMIPLLSLFKPKNRILNPWEKEFPKIFKRFYRSGQNIPESRGSGLGLTLVRHISEAHGGRVEVKSEPGSGSIFSILLPLKNWEKT